MGWQRAGEFLACALIAVGGLAVLVAAACECVVAPDPRSGEAEDDGE